MSPTCSHIPMIAGDDIKSGNFYLIFDVILSFFDIVYVCVEFIAGKDMKLWVLFAILGGVFLVVEVIIFVSYCMWKRKKKRQQQQEQPQG